jgi:hypothetical protein
MLALNQNNHISCIYLSYKAYSQTWLPQCTLRIIYMSTPISHICTEQDKKHLLAFLLLAMSTHAASYTRQTFLTLIPIKKKEKLHELHPKPIASSSCLPLHLLASLKSRQIFSTPWSVYAAIPLCYHHTIGTQEKNASTVRHGNENGCLVREQVDSTRELKTRKTNSVH